ncbi:MAG: nucleotide sugar dehydrogenase [Anaerolineales bacterium]|nr:nucleotide sugar dehydrogenase [Anaerolineales bacterium]
MTAELLEKIRNRQVRLGVVGLGYVGLPLAVEFSQAGLDVVGIDVDAGKVDALNRGDSYIPDVPAAVVAELAAAGRLCATTDYAALRDCDAVSICVPTPLNKTRDPDMSFVIEAATRVVEQAHPGFVIVLESTTYPGTTEEVLLPRLQAAGWRVGEDVFLAFSPERIDPGNPHYGVRNTPKVMGGATPACTQMAQALYAVAVDNLVPVSSMRAAEMVKLLENTFRAVNIGLVNEMALMCAKLDVDVWEVIEAASTKPYGYMKFTPGPGIGGHCIPIDPLYLSWKLKSLNYTARFIDLADAINSRMPEHVVALVADALNDDGRALNRAQVLLLGVAYKPDIDDMRESPALDVMSQLAARKACVSYHDPHVPRVLLEGQTYDCQPLTAEALAAADCVVITTNHSSYDWDWVRAHARVVVDTRNALSRTAASGGARVIRL